VEHRFSIVIHETKWCNNRFFHGFLLCQGVFRTVFWWIPVSGSWLSRIEKFTVYIVLRKNRSAEGGAVMVGVESSTSRECRDGRSSTRELQERALSPQLLYVSNVTCHIKGTMRQEACQRDERSWMICRKAIAEGRGVRWSVP
jgi:hypothetical protein